MPVRATRSRPGTFVVDRVIEALPPRKPLPRRLRRRSSCYPLARMSRPKPPSGGRRAPSRCPGLATRGSAHRISVRSRARRRRIAGRRTPYPRQGAPAGHLRGIQSVAHLKLALVVEHPCDRFLKRSELCLSESGRGFRREREADQRRSPEHQAAAIDLVGQRSDEVRSREAASGREREVIPGHPSGIPQEPRSHVLWHRPRVPDLPYHATRFRCGFLGAERGLVIER